MQDEIREPDGSHEPTEFAKQPKKAAASGWIGSALEYYDFFIYAQAAALVFPNIFFPKGDPQIAIIAAFATFGVGYVARPIGAFVLGHLGDTHGRKNMLVLCMMHDRHLDVRWWRSCPPTSRSGCWRRRCW